MTPQIIFHHAKLLEPYFVLDTKTKQPDYVLPSMEEFESSFESHKNKWLERSGIFFDALKNTFGFEYKKDTYDAYVVRGSRRSMSKPLIIAFRFNYAKFEYELMHEFIHVYLVENSFKCTVDSENKTIKNHIHLFAFLKKFYIEIIKDESMWKKIKLETKNPDYIKALEVAEEEYKNIFN